MLEQKVRHKNKKLPPSATPVRVTNNTQLAKVIEFTGERDKTLVPIVPEKSILSAVSKRTLDIVGAIALGIIALPLMFAIAIIVRTSGSPIIFSHGRVGRGQKIFKCFKFRTMVPNAEQVLKELLHSDPEVLREWRANHKLRNDPRITRFGRFLRKRSLDELPQLWNVIRGEMSLVGPRPIVADEL